MLAIEGEGMREGSQLKQDLQKRGNALVLGALLGLAAYHAWQFRFVSIDDAYITYRYAENIAMGLGFTYNPGERIEGTSTFLFTIILAVAGFLRLNLELAARCIGVASFLVLVWLVHNYVRATITGLTGGLLAAVAGLMVASSTSLAFYAALGMELLLYICLLSAGVLGYLLHARNGAHRRYWMLWLALAAATRTEALIVALAISSVVLVRGAWRCLANRKEQGVLNRRVVRTIARQLAPLVLVFMPLLAFRWLYFGSWVPNSVTAKGGFFKGLLALPLADLCARITQEQGIQMLTQFATERLGYLLLLLPLGWLSARHRHQTSTFALLGAILSAVVIWNNGDWMPHARLLAPVLPFVSIGIASALSLIESRGKSRRLVHSIQLALTIAVFAYGLDRAFYVRRFMTEPNPVAQYMIELGQALSETKGASELLATDMAGRVPYFSKLRTLDMFGLCDTHIARHGQPVLHMGKTDFPYVYRKRPDYYFYNVAQSVRTMVTSPEFRPFAHDYWIVMTPFSRDHAHQHGKILLARKDLPRLPELVHRLNATLVSPGLL